MNAKQRLLFIKLSDKQSNNPALFEELCIKIVFNSTENKKEIIK